MHQYSLQPTNELKTPLRILSRKWSERKGCSKSSQIPKYFLQNCPISRNVTGLQSTIYDESKNTLRKMFLLSVLK